MEEREEGLNIGDVEVTQGGTLLAKYVLHLVCPMWMGGQNEEEEKLGLCIRNAL